jgi:hypothetical protein
MHVTYAPEDGDRQEWDFDPGRTRAGDAEQIERQYEATWELFQIGVQTGSMRARRILLWALIRRQHPKLRLADLPDFYSDELTVEYSTRELDDMRERIAKATMPDSQREAALVAIELEMSKAMEREGVAEVGDVGKVPTPTPASPDSAPSGG